MAEIRIESVSKRFGDFVAVDHASLQIKDKEFAVLLGPSGCGKTTLLRTIAGLGMADEGRITIGDRDVTYLPARDRGISMVFQSYAIFPHMTVAANIGFGLKMAKTDKKVMADRVQMASELLHIEDMLDRYPSDMSGGQRQRVAVARAIAMQTTVLLMDEPLSNLDALLRLEMRAELKRLLADIGATTIYVTHDQIEALSMGDRIAVMKHGVIQQFEHPTKVYDFPANQFVGGFIGNPPMNFLSGNVSVNGDGGVRVTIGDLEIEPPGEMMPVLTPYADGVVTVGIRAENMEAASHPSDSALGVRVIVVEPLGSQNLLTVRIGGDMVKIATHPTFVVAADDEIWLRFPVDTIRWIDPASGKALYPELVASHGSDLIDPTTSQHRSL